MSDTCRTRQADRVRDVEEIVKLLHQAMSPGPLHLHNVHGLPEHHNRVQP